jgi:hypothetical protein
MGEDFHEDGSCEVDSRVFGAKLSLRISKPLSCNGEAVKEGEDENALSRVK